MEISLSAILRWSCFGVSCSLALLIADAVASAVLSASDSCCWLIGAIVYGTSRPSMFTVPLCCWLCCCCDVLLLPPELGQSLTLQVSGSPGADPPPPSPIPGATLVP